MWAHYAGEYSGICIGYSTSSLLRDLAPDCLLVRIQYVDRSLLLSSEDAKDTSRAARKILSYKNGRWAYEREWRLLSDKTGPVKITASDCITSIRVGARLAKDHRDEIRKIFPKTKKTKVYVMKVRDYEAQWEEM